jgi:hypothetical protein
MKDDVIIEYLNGTDARVAVSLYNDGEVGPVLEVCSMYEAKKNYNIIGELSNGEVKEYEEDDDDDADEYYKDDNDMDEDFGD